MPLIKSSGLQKQVRNAPSHLIIALARETDRWETAKRRIDYYLVGINTMLHRRILTTQRKTYRLTSQSVAPSPELSFQPLPDDQTTLSRRNSSLPTPLTAVNPLLAAHLKTPLGQSSPVPLATAKFESTPSSYQNPTPSAQTIQNMRLPSGIFSNSSNPSPADILSSLNQTNTAPQPIPDDQLSELQSFIGGSDLGGGEIDFSGIDMSALDGLFPAGSSGVTPQPASASASASANNGAAELEQLQAFLDQNQTQDAFAPQQSQSFTSGDAFGTQPTFSEPQADLTSLTQSQDTIGLFDIPPVDPIQPQPQQQSQQQPQPQQPQQQQSTEALSGLGLDMGNTQAGDGLQMGPEELELLLAGWQE